MTAKILFSHSNSSIVEKEIFGCGGELVFLSSHGLTIVKICREEVSLHARVLFISSHAKAAGRLPCSEAVNFQKPSS